MKKWECALLIFMLAFMSCNTTNESEIQRIDGSTISEKKLDETIKKLIDEADVTGLAVTIFNDKEMTYQKAFGYANMETKEALDLDHIFYGASLSKSVFAYLVAHLVDENKIVLDEPLSSYFDVDLPDIPTEKEFRHLRDLKGDKRYEQFTTRMCLSHSTGLPNWRWINNP
ncbi:MAG: serine hydrolase, partial [Bacteroidota bacterium]